jgi:hypothetical protein
MVSFEAYLCEAQERMNLDPIQLIRDWKHEEIQSVIENMNNAIRSSEIIGSQITDLKGTNQSKGNQVENYLVSKLSDKWIPGNGIYDAPGRGYPDRIFKVGTRRFLMEIKATSNWKNDDSIRRVLTATPEKMRKLIESEKVDRPPAHIICTIVYSEITSTVSSIRTDFINRDTEIDVRFEASTSQKRLTNGCHRTEIFS